MSQGVPPIPPTANPAFEVATVKPSDPKDGSTGFHMSGRQIYIENETLQDMVIFAYGVHPRQIVNAPDWVSKERFDVKGVPDAKGMPDVNQLRGMVQTLIADRFGLKVHKESREMTVYALRVSKTGLKIARAAKDSSLAEDQTGNGDMMRFTSNSMPDFVLALETMVDRPVVDQTGLAGRYDFTLRWRPDGAPRHDDDVAQPLFSAIPEQLGLRLEATKANAEVLVVEHVERPSAN